jgi:DNA-directed RNA polymerase specialized sigma24 family protein
MDINLAYADYVENPSQDSVAALFTALRSYGLALGRAYRHSDAENAASEAVAAAWSSLDSFRPRPGATFRAWFRQIVIHTVMSDFRRDSRPTVDLQDWTDVPVAEHVSFHVDDLENLTPDQVVTLKNLIKTEDFDATARELGISKNALALRLTRIKNKIRTTRHISPSFSD